MEFLNIGYPGHPIQNMTHGVTVPSGWIQEMREGDPEKREVWAKVLRARADNGYPYIFFEDNVQDIKADVYKALNMPVRHSNLCTEILLPSSEDESFVCVLLSTNLLHYNEWKDTDLIEVAVFFLDTVVTEFLDRLEEYRDSDNKEDQLTFKYMERAYNFAKRHRALGLGAMGWHSFLQSQMLAMNSPEADELNALIFENIQRQSYTASEKLATIFGEPEILEGYGRRNATLNAIAPTTSSAFILGQVSQSIEPYLSNCYIKDLANIKAVVKNPFLEKLLEEKGYNTPKVWDTIAKDSGSVANLDFLSEHEKEVFMTFQDIPPAVIIRQAAMRQMFLDQTQSLNLMIDSRFSAKDVNQLILMAYDLGIPTLYYQRSVNSAQEYSRLRNADCVACEA